MSSKWREPKAPKSAKPATYENALAEILVSLDYANLDMDFPRIVHWLRQLPTGDRDRLLGELEAIAATDAIRRDDATYLLDGLGLRRIHWEQP
ncbi:hypothetical protein [Kitasatospora kifunensis]|uniref:Uncharacterized protein n=1 Tax=Kitasatospora kifunensis TaxID=58351 RepID=A0A7W7R1S8_KITKI|nr:hypothetical protein [Kitasatospora kifunensis]MBB4923618.1 hypothetical protein [Kitasatospora kifunensis]